MKTSELWLKPRPIVKWAIKPGAERQSPIAVRLRAALGEHFVTLARDDRESVVA